MANIDEIDRKLLQLLKRDARLGSAALARKIGLSRSAAHARVVRLESLKVIRRFTIEADPDHEGEARAVFLIRLANASRCQPIAKSIEAYDDVRWVYCLSGEFEIAALADCERNADLLDLRDTLISLSGVRDVSIHSILRGN